MYTHILYMQMILVGHKSSYYHISHEHVFVSLSRVQEHAIYLDYCIFWLTWASTHTYTCKLFKFGLRYPFFSGFYYSQSKHAWWLRLVSPEITLLLSINITILWHETNEIASYSSPLVFQFPMRIHNNNNNDNNYW